MARYWADKCVFIFNVGPVSAQCWPSFAENHPFVSQYWANICSIYIPGSPTLAQYWTNNSVFTRYSIPYIILHKLNLKFCSLTNHYNYSWFSFLVGDAIHTKAFWFGLCICAPELQDRVPPPLTLDATALGQSAPSGFFQINLLHAFCMSISFFFGRGKTFARWMNLGTMNLLKNCALCRTVSLRFEAAHKLLLTFICNWLRFIDIVSLAVGLKTILRTSMLGEVVNHSKGHRFLSLQIPRPVLNPIFICYWL